MAVKYFLLCHSTAITVSHWPFSGQFQHLAKRSPFWSAKFPIHLMKH